MSSRRSPPPSVVGGYLPLGTEERPFPSPASPTFRDKGSSSFSAATDSSDASDDSFPARGQRRASVPAVPVLMKLRHGLLGKLSRLTIVVGTLFLLHQLVFPSSSTRQYVSSTIRPAYTGSEPSYKGVMESTLSRIGLKSDKLDPYITALEKRLADPPLPPYKFLVGTMEHNEEPDIVEWVLYHIAQGVDHFVVYDHFSTDNTRELLRPFEDLGWVTYVQYNQEGRWAQPLAFEKFMKEWAAHSKWLFFFDIDEYITRNTTLLAGTGELDEPFVPWFDRKYSDGVGGVALPRLSFSSNGHYSPPADGPLSGFTETRELDRNFYVPKIVSQARFKKPGGDIHKQEFEGGRRLVDPSGKSGEGMWEDRGGYPAYMHHYWAKSWDECVAKIKQTAFPGSWREQMGDKFCRQEMSSTDDHAQIPHIQDASLARYGPLVRLAKERFQARYPPFSLADYRLSTVPSLSSSKRTPFASSDRRLQPGATFVLDYNHGAVGHVDVSLSTASTRRALALTYRPDGGVSFSLPPLSQLDPGSGFHELTITLQHPALPSPIEADVSPCSIMGHLKNRPEVVQLQAMAETVCRETDVEGAWELQVKTAPHSHYRGEVLFRRFFEIDGAARIPPSSSSAAPSSSSSSLATTPLSLSALGHGRWKQNSLMDYPGGAATATNRLYISERCPNRFTPSYWDDACGNSSTVYNPTGGVFRWVPHGLASYHDLAVPPEDLKSCLAAPGSARSSADGGVAPKRIVVVGDSVASHTYLALLCMMDQVPGLNSNDHVRFSSFQYESFNLAGTLDPLAAEDWTRLVAWEWDAGARVARNMPDVVVLNVGLWPVSWGTAEGYERGLESALRRLKEAIAAAGAETKIVWRETTAVHPTAEGGADPLHQTNPRVELFNAIADRVVDSVGGITRIPAYEMTAAIPTGQARDNAHVCPPVQGDMAEVLMRGLCDHVLR
ncbi:hypothetical protein JCM6882_000226 [Rhodosporidiobolus microsporus]